MLTEEKREEYTELLKGKFGWCLTCNVHCFTPEELHEHHTNEHEKIWVVIPEYPCLAY